MKMVLALLALLGAAVPGAAQDRLDTVAAGVDRAIGPAPAAAARLARLLGTPPDVLRAERASTQPGWGDLVLSHRIAARGGHPIAKVFAARRTGATWDQIATEARVDADALAQEVAALWPEAAPVPPAGPAAAGPPAPAPPASEERTGFGGPTDRARDEIRDRMLRGGGRGW